MPDSLETRFPRRARRWRLRSQVIEFTRVPRIMGIVNVTPDSFSDGGKFFDAAAAIDQGLALASQGADILDVGGESTRPHSTPVDEAEELRRVIPVIRALCERSGVPVSIDTSKARVAREAIQAGAAIINDVTGLMGDPVMLDVALESRAGVCVMHMRGTPATMQDDPTYRDVVAEILVFLRQRRDHLLSAGIPADQICLDPGIGFGKTHQHNLTLLAHSAHYHELGCPLLVGPSRKAFIGKVLRDQDVQRTAGTIGVVLSLARQGVQIVRVHDVAPVRQALLLFAASGGVDGVEARLDD